MSKFFSSLNSVSFRQKVIFSSVFLLIMVLILGALTYLNTTSLQSMFSEYRQVARQNLELSNVQEGLQTIRSKAFAYRSNGDENLRQDIEKALTEMEQAKDRLKELSQKPETIAIINKLSEEIETYTQAFYDASQLNEKIQSVRDDVFYPVGRKARLQITNLNKQLEKLDETEALALGGDLVQHLLLGRYYGAKFFSYSNPDHAQRAKMEFEISKETAEQLASALRQRPQLQSQIDEILEDTSVLHASFDDVVPLINQKTDLYTNVLDQVGPIMAADIKSLASQYQDTQNTIGPEMTDGFKVIVSQSIFVAVLVVLIGTGLIIYLIRSLIAMSDRVRAKINEMSQAFSVATDELSHMAQELVSAVNNTTERCTVMASASEESSTNVQTVASASEELSAAIADVSQNIQRAASQSRMTAEEANNTQSQLDELQGAISAVDDIILAINNVAEQTNLLALNATIEAARAGDAGKGFAVVANEVKALADETKAMTDNITEQIKKVNLSSEQAIEATRKIIKQIEAIDTVTKDVAASVEQQSSATKEISQNAQEAHTGTDSVTQNIVQIQSANEQTDSVARNLTQSAETIRTRSEEMNASLRAFLKELNKDAA